jgi:sugar transferase (PEP-CTERM/EpsH1 system associated)
MPANRVHILHVVDNLGKGGLENGLANVINGLDRDLYDHSILVIRHLGAIADHLSGRARIIHLDKKPGGSRVQIGTFAEAIHNIKPDIVHSRNWGAIEAVAAARVLRVPSVIHSEHGLDPDQSDAPRRRTLFRRVSYSLANRVLCVSRQLLQYHSAQTGFAANKMTVIHNGVDVQRFQPQPAARARVREELGFSHDELCIVAVGNLTRVKDHATLLRAIDRFNHACRQPWRLVLYGCGPEEGELKRFVAGHPEWAHRVSFAGLIDRIPELLSAFDIYVLTSLTEGISNSLLEGMAAGIPAIASDTGGNPEVIVDGESGVLFPVGADAVLASRLIALQSNVHLREHIGEDGRRRVRHHFSLDAMVRAYCDVYRSEMERSGRRRHPGLVHRVEHSRATGKASGGEAAVK